MPTTFHNLLMLMSPVAHANPEASWIQQHIRAIRNIASKSKHEQAIVTMLRGWLMYADAHRGVCEDEIGNDYFLGVAWIEAGKALRTLLNGETGRLDCGTVDGIIIAAFKMAEVEPKELY